MKYRKRPIVIEANQFRYKQLGSEWFIHQPMEGVRSAKTLLEKLKDWHKGFTHYYCDTLEGTSYALTEGDYVIKGIKGEFYPCKPDIFEASYELVES